MDILINNFPSPVSKLTPLDSNGMECKDFKSPTLLLGFDMGGNIKALNDNVLSKLFISLILYDSLIMVDTDFRKLINLIGFDDCFTLLKVKKVKLIYGEIDFSMEFLNKNGSKLKLNTDIKPIPLLPYMENNFQSYTERKSIKSAFIQSIENAMINKVNDSETDELNSLIIDNLKKDIMNKEISNQFLNGVESIACMDPYQTTSVLRLINTLKGFSLQEKYKIGCIVQDSFSKDYLSSKLAFYNRKPITDKVEYFSDVCSIKRIPNIYDLYRRKSISINDIINISNENKTKKFNEWFNDDHLTKEDILFALTKSHKNSHLLKSIRWTLPNIAGLVNPLLGLASSFCDNFLVDKVINGWSPNIFLDDVLKEKIDALVQKKEKEHQRKLIIKRFGSIKPNEKCPCQSGLKFKKCHGDF
jgi:hypothetical protein